MIHFRINFLVKFFWARPNCYLNTIQSIICFLLLCRKVNGKSNHYSLYSVVIVQDFLSNTGSRSVKMSISECSTTTITKQSLAKFSKKIESKHPRLKILFVALLLFVAIVGKRKSKYLEPNPEKYF